MDKEKFRELAKTLMLEADDQILENLEKEFNFLEKKIIDLQSIDTTNVEPLIWIDNTPINFMRKDEVKEESFLSQEIILKNSQDSQGNYIAIPKVVKNHE